MGAEPVVVGVIDALDLCRRAGNLAPRVAPCARIDRADVDRSLPGVRQHPQRVVDLGIGPFVAGVLDRVHPRDEVVGELALVAGRRGVHQNAPAALDLRGRELGAFVRAIFGVLRPDLFRVDLLNLVAHDDVGHRTVKLAERLQVGQARHGAPRYEGL